jgi:hypothetical protein
MEIPVYLFTGFLGGGKTTFIQETLEDERFNNGERTLLIVCEEGEEEYAPDKFSGTNVFVRTLESEDDLIGETLTKWRRETRAVRVLIEYNGMWMLDKLYEAMPREWVVYQEFSFAEASTYVVYNANMRNLVVDKLKCGGIDHGQVCVGIGFYGLIYLGSGGIIGGVGRGLFGCVGSLLRGIGNCGSVVVSRSCAGCEYACEHQNGQQACKKSFHNYLL